MIGIDGGNGNTILPHPTDAADRYFLFGDTTLTEDDFTSLEDLFPLIDEQMVILNDSFSETPFYFTLVNEYQLYPEEDWTRYPGTYGNQISEELGVSDLTALNVFLVYNAGILDEEDDGSTTVAFATFASYQYLKTGDGVFQRFDSLPGGGFTGTDAGFTLPHEVGKPHGTRAFGPVARAFMTARIKSKIFNFNGRSLARTFAHI